MNRRTLSYLAALAALAVLTTQVPAQQGTTPQAAKVVAAEDCTSAKLGTELPVASIGEPVAGVTLAAPKWVAAAANAPAYCSVDGVMAPTDKSANGRPINFRVVLPASWTSHAVQLGGGGMNGSIPGLTGGEASALRRSDRYQSPNTFRISGPRRRDGAQQVRVSVRQKVARDETPGTDTQEVYLPIPDTTTHVAY